MGVPSTLPNISVRLFSDAASPPHTSVDKDQEGQYNILLDPDPGSLSDRAVDSGTAAVARVNADAQKQLSALLDERKQLSERLNEATTQEANLRKQQAVAIAQMKEPFARELRLQTDTAVQKVRDEAERQLAAKNVEHLKLTEKVGQLETREATLRAQNSEAIGRLKADFAEQLKRRDIEAGERARTAVAQQLQALEKRNA